MKDYKELEERIRNETITQEEVLAEVCLGLSEISEDLAEFSPYKQLNKEFTAKAKIFKFLSDKLKEKVLEV